MERDRVQKKNGKLLLVMSCNQSKMSVNLEGVVVISAWVGERVKALMFQ